ncbi:MFS transporter [Corynebacterium belfantii]|uniref:MFS transporter n=1 Tax=Corynebacterium belfantii TaxID=2014537 RepID=A0ABS0LAI2_9CORY|nr:MFS transporter [Corynebacterium belfantii]OLN15908.1 MFS transporter [Corynebacterium diphtheriae] [Corynebacterium diphtheriae subsp. lausannense]STC67431.1 major facilitator superfamily permease [Corynebacterium diphtheriae]MBG9244396.1 MFS transporter [Corynebacterium belfantii]MBG9333070.1 MFS transporter [Corynebacterium belfantii]MBG9346653.1 MFS transporter [Corynebacterium belfantii]
MAVKTAATVTKQPNAMRWWALVVLMLPVLLVSVDNTVLAFALPEISTALQPTGNQQLWIVDVYGLMLAGLLIPMGALGDRWGRRRLLLIGGIGFTLTSIIAALVPTASLLIVSRAVMGFFGASLMPATLSLIRNIFTVPKERRLAIAVWASCFSGGSALGPIVGGFLLEHYYWGSIFWMSVPILVPMVLLAPLVVPESKDTQPGPIDVPSILLMLAVMVPLVYGIKDMAHQGLSPWIGVGAVIVAISAWWLIRRQLHAASPMFDVRLFMERHFTGAVLANLLSMISLVGFLYYISQHFQLVSGHSPMVAGLLLLPGTAATILAGLVVVKLAAWLTPRKLVTAGLLLNAVGYFMIMVAGDAGSDWGLVAAFILVGIGVGAAETISNDMIMAAAPPAKAGAASAISETAYEIGAVLGTTVLGSVLNAAYRRSIEIPTGISPDQGDIARETLGGATEIAHRVGGVPGAELLASARHAFDHSVVFSSSIAVGLMLGAATLSLILLRGAKLD